MWPNGPDSETKIQELTNVDDKITERTQEIDLYFEFASSLSISDDRARPSADQETRREREDREAKGSCEAEKA